MPSFGIGLSTLALLLGVGAWVAYFRSVVRVQVSRRAAGHLVAHASASALAIVGIVLAGGAAAALAWGIPAMMLAALFFALYSQRRTPVGELRVAVGDRLLPFAATTSEGVPFRSEQLAGRRVLLKFFRGQW